MWVKDKFWRLAGIIQWNRGTKRHQIQKYYSYRYECSKRDIVLTTTDAWCLESFPVSSTVQYPTEKEAYKLQ